MQRFAVIHLPCIPTFAFTFRNGRCSAIFLCAGVNSSLRLLKPGGRAAVIVPDGVLFGSSNVHKSLRRMLIEHQKLDAIISLPGGVFKPYAGVSTAILPFTKTNSGGIGGLICEAADRRELLVDGVGGETA